MNLDRDFMKMAIEEAKLCDPSDPSRIPRVGAVVVHEGVVIGRGHRGPDNHAEFEALGTVVVPQYLQESTVFTTLEPCTGAVRSKPLEACTSLLTQSQVRKVVIGMLDPNQAVCGKGVLELQKHGIEVSLFEHDLAQEIRELNAAFIRAQQSLGLEILSPSAGADLHTYKTGGTHEFRCRVNIPPDDEIFVVIERGGLWWPQGDRLRQVGTSNEYVFKANFGSIGEHTVHVVRASPLGTALINYYRSVSSRNRERHGALLEKVDHAEQHWLGPLYPGISMLRLPRGLDSQGSVLVNIVPNRGV